MRAKSALTAYLARRDGRGETFRVDQLTDSGWEADLAVRQALPAYLHSALA
ncbi:hypothetical protein [Streptomyces sp. NPDC002250]|uniref:hypothetical protein n=1 Tax=Streptomyces sp. NPDC002250 TaxID=3364641 RepID=UPI00367A8BC0